MSSINIIIEGEGKYNTSASKIEDQGKEKILLHISTADGISTAKFLFSGIGGMLDFSSGVQRAITEFAASGGK